MIKLIKIYKKNLYITLKNLNKSFLVYNGKSFQKLVVSKNMVGSRFGEYIYTRKFFKFKKKKNNKK
jgi:ribosomal protein S19